MSLRMLVPAVGALMSILCATTAHGQYEYLEAFDGPLDPATFEIDVDATFSYIIEDGHMTVASDGTQIDDLELRIQWLPEVLGDFVVELGYELVTFPVPSSGENKVALRAYDLDLQQGTVIARRRNYDGEHDDYAAWTTDQGLLAAAETDDMAGTLRMSRVGDSLSLSFKGTADPDFQPLWSGQRGNGPVRLAFAARRAYSDTPIVVRFDDFYVIADNVVIGDMLNGLTGYWSFDEASGSTVYDSSGAGHDGGIFGATWTSGVSGSALEFNGQTDYVAIATMGFGPSFTVSARARPGSFNNDEFARQVFNSTGDLTQGDNIVIAQKDTDKWLARIWDRSTVESVCIIYGPDAVPGRWYHLLYTFDADSGSARFFVDGVSWGEAAWGGSIVGADSTPQIGRHLLSPRYFHGTIDEVRVYDRALSADEVAFLFAYPGGMASESGSDLALRPDDIVFLGDSPDVTAEVTVHNWGVEAATNIGVSLLKHTAGSGYVVVGSSQITGIPGLAQATVSIVFTPDFVGQEIKVVASLPIPSDDVDLSNNVAFTTWSGATDAPSILSVDASHDGKDSPDEVGRFISGVSLSSDFFAEVSDPQGDQDIEEVSFTLGTDVVYGMRTWTGKWKATFDMGDLDPGLHTLTVVAADLAGSPSDPIDVTIEVIDLPSWAEGENSSFEAAGFDRYKLGGFFPAEWAYQHSMPPEWLLIGEKENYFRAGLYTAAEVGLDGQVYESFVAPCIYVELLDIDITKILEGVAEFQAAVKKINKIWDDVLAGKKEATIHFDQAAAVAAVLDDDTLEVVGYGASYSASVESKWFEKSLTGVTPVFFTIAGWPMSFEASLGAKIAAALTITATMDGWQPVFVQPTFVEPSVAARISGTINVVEIGIAAVGASLRPTVTFAYNIGWVPPGWDRDWLIRFALDICARLRLGLGPLSQDYDLGCATLFDYDWDSEGKAIGGDYWRDPPVDPLGVLNRPVIIGSLGRGERVLVYAIDDPDGNPAEIAAQVDPGTGQWGPQTFLTSDLYADLDPTMAYTSDGRAVTIWTKVETLAADLPGSTIDELIGTFDLYSSVWDGVGWSAPVALTDDAAGDGLAKVAFSDVTTDGLVVWCRDEASDFDDPAGDEIAYATWDGASWSAPTLLTSDTLGDRQVAICYRAGTSDALAVWSKETDPIDQLLTLYYAEWDGVSWSAPDPVPGLPEERTAQVNLAPLSDGRVVAAWGVQADDGWQIRLAIFDAATGWGTIETVQSQLTLVDGMQLRVSNDDVVHLFWHGFTLDDDLFGMSKALGTRSDTWVGPTKLTAGAEIEWQATGVVSADSELALVYAREQGRSREPLSMNRNGLPDELGGSTVPGDGNWTVTDSDLTLLGNPWLHETVTVEAVLTNTGTTESVATTAQFWLGDPNDPQSGTLGEPIDVHSIVPLDTLIITSEEFDLDEVGPLDIWLVVAPPMAESDPADNEAMLSIDVINNDTTSPQVSDAQIVELRDEGRLGVRITITFDEAMAPITASDLALFGVTSGQSVPDNVWMDPAGEVLTVVFEDRLSADGYTFTILGRVTDEAGNELDGNGDGTGGDDYVLAFSLLTGDLDLDGDVDLDDFSIFAGLHDGAGGRLSRRMRVRGSGRRGRRGSGRLRQLPGSIHGAVRAMRFAHDWVLRVGH